MSFSTLRHPLTQFIYRILKLLGSICKLPPIRLIIRLFVFLVSSGRRVSAIPRRPVLKETRDAPTPIATLDSGIVCAMNVPPTSGPETSHAPPATRSRPSRGHSVHFIPTAPSGLLNPPPHHPTRRRAFNCNPPTVTADIIVQSTSTSTFHSLHSNHAQNSETSSRPPSSNHHSVDMGPEILTGRTQLSRTSSLSFPQEPWNSRRSTGRDSYRRHHGLSRIRPPRGDQPVVGPTTDSPRFFPMSVTGVLRYNQHETRSPSELDYDIQAMAYQYPQVPERVPEGWSAYRHPEGALYFVHNDSKTFTEVNMCDDVIHADVECFRSFLFVELESEIKSRSLSDSELSIEDVQLVLEPRTDERGVMCCYYFVNPSTRSLFWLDDWKGYELFEHCKGALSYQHKGLAIQAHYWCAAHSFRVKPLTISSDFRSHWDLYPNFCEVTQELKDEVLDLILHATCSHLTSNSSSCPLNTEELKGHLFLIKEIDPAKIGERKHSAIITGRIMHIFYNNYFLNFYGEGCARLNFDQTVYGWKYHPSVCMSLFAPLLFMVPMKNVRLLHRIFVDGVASKEKWNMFATKLSSQLDETRVLAIMLINANIAFLSKEPNAAQQFLTYMSLVVNVASITLGLVFMAHGRAEVTNTPFKEAKWHKTHGLQRLAFIYSLPHAFLMWGMCLFFAAFATQWYYTGDTGTRASAAVVMLVVALLVGWSIWPTWWFQQDPNRAERKQDDGNKSKETAPQVEESIHSESQSVPESCYDEEANHLGAGDQTGTCGANADRFTEAGFSAQTC